jgi:hypothetical protein
VRRGKNPATAGGLELKRRERRAPFAKDSGVAPAGLSFGQNALTGCFMHSESRL